MIERRQRLDLLSGGLSGLRPAARCAGDLELAFE